jgi:hypothetical protein
MPELFARFLGNMGIMPIPIPSIVTNQQQDTDLLKYKTLNNNR